MLDLSINQAHEIISLEDNETMQKVYDAVISVLDCGNYYSVLIDDPEFIIRCKELSDIIDSFDTFKSKFGIIKKGGSYFIVESPEFIGKYTESYGKFDEEFIALMLTLPDLNRFAESYYTVSGDVTNKVIKLLKITDKKDSD